jgi:Protein of Unknown function (DUF2784)
VWYGILADVVVAVHVAYVSFVVLGQLAILAGVWRGWAWVRNRWFRLAHLLAIMIVALEAVFNIACPLTVWEGRLREAAGSQAVEGTFIGRWLHDLIFFELPPWVFTAVYVGFAVLVLATLWWVPPRWRRS